MGDNSDEFQNSDLNVFSTSTYEDFKAVLTKGFSDTSTLLFADSSLIQPFEQLEKINALSNLNDPKVLEG